MQLGNIPCLFDCYLMQSQPLGNCFMDTINSWVSIPRKSGYLLFLWFRLYASFLQEHSVPACPCSWFVLLWVILAKVIPIFGGSYYILLSMLNNVVTCMTACTSRLQGHTFYMYICCLYKLFRKCFHKRSYPTNIVSFWLRSRILLSESYNDIHSIFVLSCSLYE